MPRYIEVEEATRIANECAAKMADGYEKELSAMRMGLRACLRWVPSEETSLIKATQVLLNRQP